MSFEGREGRRRFSRESSFGPREMHKAVCADCGAECEVPFKPSGERPVYCRDCWAKRKPRF
jgi:CxxC-x17-CxxC domain-containing protein